MNQRESERGTAPSENNKKRERKAKSNSDAKSENVVRERGRNA